MNITEKSRESANIPVPKHKLFLPIPAPHYPLHSPPPSPALNSPDLGALRYSRWQLGDSRFPFVSGRCHFSDTQKIFTSRKFKSFQFFQFSFRIAVTLGGPLLSAITRKVRKLTLLSVSRYLSVSMGLTVSRQTAKNLTVNRQKWENFTVNRQKSSCH